LLAPGGSGTWGGFDKPTLLRLGSNNDLVVAGGPGTIARFTAKGDLVWGRSLAFYVAPMRGVALPDGSFTLVGTRFNDLWIANFSEAGDRNWWVSFAPTGGMTIQDLVLGANAQGQPEYYLVGHVQRALVTRSDPQVIKFDALGQVLWAQSYDLPDKDDEAHGAVLTADGNLVLSGRTGHPVAPPAIGTPDPGNILKTACALLMKVSGSDGSLLWARNYPSQWGLNLYRVVEAPDGTLFAAGSAGRIVTQTRPSNLFARFKSDGTLIDHVTVGEDADWPDELPSGGNTPYDNVQDLVWTPEGLVACGVTGLGTGTAGWVMGLTEELGVRFFSVFDGPKAEDLLRVVDAGDGLAVLGNTYSAYPWGAGRLKVPVLMKLPWEGIMRFHPDSKFQSRYLQPRVYKSSADLQFIVYSTRTTPGAPPQSFFSSSGTVPFAVNPVPISPGGPLPELTALPNFLTYAIEAVDFGQVTDYNSWAAYHQLTGTNTPPTADPDGDGLANYLEAYFGRNPFQAETAPVLSVTGGQTSSQPMIAIEYDRAPFAGSFNVRVESSEDLRWWNPATDLLQIVVPSDARKERVRLTATPDRPYRYFRIGSPSP
jgi:hypothetical protein